MFNFSKFIIKKNNQDNFVGIRKCPLTGQFEFCLPLGFDDFPEENFECIKNLFFSLYRTFRKFEKDNINNEKFKLNKSEYQKNQDQTILEKNGVTLINDQEESCIIYSKIRMIEQVLDAYDPLVIQSILQKERGTDKVNYSNILKYLHKAIYLDDDVIFIDKMDLPSPTLHYQSTDIVTLFCYILTEIIKQLQEDVSENIKNNLKDIHFLGEQFKKNYLTDNQSIFIEKTSPETLKILKKILEIIDQNTYYKDNDYWEIYEAIELFLYGDIDPQSEDGEYWGVKGFSFVWEDMCHTYFFRNSFQDIVYADTDIRLKNYENGVRKDLDVNRVGNYCLSNKDENNLIWIYTVKSPNNKETWQDLLCIEYDLSSKTLNITYNLTEKLLRRFLRPDLVLKKLDKIKIYDYKYVDIEFYENNCHKNFCDTSQKYRVDLIKQMTYELALQSIPKMIVEENAFLIPSYINNNNLFFETIGIKITEGIKIYNTNFLIIQKYYIEENL
jgi:hypothetical protein